ncbi:hypothetical protein [Roseicitreum antarcticum]|uniref:hypothetical protein n=1 Tax=Roseicitreum antarcticum TaxID=564137 RepID=UPI001680BB9F|nr:hypothetical protein [Roseicitreum antarcticum]
MLSKFHGTLFLGGGFVRAVVAGEQPSDVDLFGPSKELLTKIAEELQASRGGKQFCRLHHTRNAITVISIGRITVQFITRWEFADAKALVSSFDFSVCQAVIFRDGGTKKSPWSSVTGPRFYIDLAARRIHYTHPVREEEAGGSLMRALKYQRRGYVMQIESLAGVVSRLVAKLDPSKVDTKDEGAVTRIMLGLLQEVDPSIAVDGLEITDDHETPIEGFSEADQS